VQNRTWQNRRTNAVLTAFILVLSILMISPFVLMLSTSLQSMGELRGENIKLIPEKPLFSNYPEAMKRGNWGRYFFNTALVTVLAVVISLIINSVAGYSFARLNFRGRDALFVFSLIGFMIPQHVTMIPVFLILKSVPFAGGNNIFGSGGTGWIDTYMGLLAPYIAHSFGVFLFRQFYLNFPTSLDDAARIDGLGPVGRYTQIYIPLSKPIIASLIALKATHVWNEYTWPLILTQSDEMKTIQLALQHFQGADETAWTLLMAATTIVLIPLLIIFISVQRYFISGVVTSGIKG
jgi:multiple sugar transport system permease protein